jgi:hypothetical protein
LIASILAQNDMVAVVGIFLVAYGSAVLASHKQFGTVVMVLCAPVVAIGLSYSDLGEAAGMGAFMLAGSVWSYAVFLQALRGRREVRR